MVVVVVASASVLLGLVLAPGDADVFDGCVMFSFTYFCCMLSLWPLRRERGARKGEGGGRVSIVTHKQTSAGKNYWEKTWVEIHPTERQLLRCVRASLISNFN